jgi:2-oxoisovalerate dehydrogenase E1 component
MATNILLWQALAGSPEITSKVFKSIEYTMPTKKKMVTKSKAKKVSRTASRAKFDREFAQWAYKAMMLSRLIDDKTITLYKQNKCHFQISCSGHEAVQVAAAHVFRPGQDWFFPYYRDMALMVALGMTAEELLMNAMNKVDDPNSHGRMMPMHYGSLKLRVPPQSSPTGSQFLPAVGCAVGAKLKELDEVIYVSAGEGTCSQGDFHEALNWASRDKLPIVFVIENNSYAISVHVSEQLGAKSVAALASNYENVHSTEVDGSDLTACVTALQAAHDRARRGEGPSLIEAHVPRLLSHSISDNHLKYRTKEDIAKEQKRCPIKRQREVLVKQKISSEKEIDSLNSLLKQLVDDACDAAERSPDPSPDTALLHNFKQPAPGSLTAEEPATGEEVFIVDAINHALDEELARNPDMLIYGEDVAHGKGGVFTVTAGLTAKYGVNRVFNSQLAESSIVGTAIGLSMRGMKPVVEIQFGDYVWTAMNQIRNELALIHYRSAGDFSCPAVLRIPVGGYIRGGAYHSQNIEATFAHFPGLYVIYPSNASDAKGLLKSAIRADDPVLFLEHKGLYRQVYAKGPEGDANHLVPIGKAKTVRVGTDLTIVTWGALVQKSLLVAQRLESEGRSVEVIDLRTIVPFDREHVFESVRKTGRVVIAHEDVVFGGFGGEIAAQIAEDCFTYLDAPVKRVGMKYAAAVPHAPVLEDVVLPQEHDLIEAVRGVLGF